MGCILFRTEHLNEYNVQHLHEYVFGELKLILNGLVPCGTSLPARERQLCMHAALFAIVCARMCVCSITNFSSHHVAIGISVVHAVNCAHSHRAYALHYYVFSLLQRWEPKNAIYVCIYMSTFSILHTLSAISIIQPARPTAESTHTHNFHLVFHSLLIINVRLCWQQHFGGGYTRKYITLYL